MKLTWNRVAGIVQTRSWSVKFDRLPRSGSLVMLRSRLSHAMNSLQKSLTNFGALSVMTLFGKPWSFEKRLMNACRAPSPVTGVEQIKCEYPPILSRVTSMLSQTLPNEESTK